MMSANEPSKGDVVLGGNNELAYAAILGGIEGAKKRLGQAQTFSDKTAAIREIEKYDPFLAQEATQQLIKLSLNISPESIESINKAFTEVIQSATIPGDPALLEPLKQLSLNLVAGFNELGRRWAKILIDIDFEISQFKQPEEPCFPWLNPSIDPVKLQETLADLNREKDMEVEKCAKTFPRKNTVAKTTQPQNRTGKKSIYLQGVEKILKHRNG